MNTAITVMGAGGSHPSNIQIIDKISIVVDIMLVISGIFGGTVNNILGPRFTLMLGASGYPVYVGSLW